MKVLYIFEKYEVNQRGFSSEGEDNFSTTK